MSDYRQIDLHTHTTFCDGKNTPAEMVAAALERGMEAVGICVHTHTPVDEEYCASPEDIRAFLAEMDRLKDKYRGSIRVLAGAEQDLYSDTDVRPFDYVIASAHYVKVGDEYFPVDESEAVFRKLLQKLDGDWLRLAQLYFDAVAESVRRSHPDIIGHLDLVTKFNENGRFFDETDPRYLAAAYDLIDRLLPCNVPFEVNTGAISRGYRTAPYPAKPLRDYILSRGGRLILSSDAHRKQDLMFGFEELASLQNSSDYSFLDRTA